MSVIIEVFMGKISVLCSCYIMLLLFIYMTLNVVQNCRIKLHHSFIILVTCLTCLSWCVRCENDTVSLTSSASSQPPTAGPETQQSRPEHGTDQ